MSPSPRALACLALHRFGLGARPGDLDRVAPDPRARVLEEIAGPVPAPEGPQITTVSPLSTASETPSSTWLRP